LQREVPEPPRPAAGSAETARRRVRPSRRALLYAAMVVLFGVAPLFVWVFGPPFFLFDSYNYMFRGLHPSAYGIHPFGFGFVLRAIAAVSGPLWQNAFSHLFTVWQVACIAFVCVVGVLDRRRKLAPMGRARRVLVFLLAAASLGLMLPSLLYLANGFVSEPTAFALLVGGALAFARAHDGGGYRPWIAFGVLCWVGYQIRFQFAALPVAAMLVLAARGVTRRIRPGRFGRHLLLVGGVLLVVLSSQRAFAAWMTVDEFGRRQPEVFLRKTVQCTLGCSVRMFEVTCDSRKGRRLILGTPCWELMGAPESELGDAHSKQHGLLATLLSLSASDLVRFAVRAPTRYLGAKQNKGVEVFSHAFDENVEWFSEHVPDVIAHYRARFVHGESRPAPAFGALTRYLEKLYLGSAFHWVAAVAFYGSLLGLFVARDTMSACLYATTVVTFLLFSYFQPQFPIRYAVHLILPATLAAWRGSLEPWVP
jgi:hypothetical protein